MRGFKGFNQDLTCTMGRGTFKYEIGKTYKEDKADIARTGFHFVEEPLEVLRWYPNGRFCMVEASGDIDEASDRLSCTEITIIKELTIEELYAWEVRFIMENPKREISRAYKETGIADSKRPILVIGKNPKAKGVKGSSLFIIQKIRGRIRQVGGFTVDGKDVKANVFYSVEGEKVND